MSLGEFKGFPYILYNKICKVCNNKFGAYEEQFGRSGPEAFFRKYLGIQGRDTHDTVNPFLRGSVGAKPIDFLATLPGDNLDILWEFNPEGKTVREVRQIVFIDEDAKSYPVRIPDWIKNTDQIRPKIKKLGIKGKMISAKVFAPNDEINSVESLVSSLGESFKWLPPQPIDNINGAQINVYVTDLYFRAVAKIGFHFMKYFFEVIIIYINDGKSEFRKQARGQNGSGVQLRRALK